MEQFLNLEKTETLSREIIKSAFSISNKRFEKTAKEIIASTSTAFSLLNLAALSNERKERVEKVAQSIEKLALVKFWVDFSIAENISLNNVFLSFSGQLSELLQTLASTRKKEEAKLRLSASYVGEWFLDD